MPIKLRRDAIRLFEASCEALHIAVTQLGASKRYKHRTYAAYAIEIGLIGAAAELAMSACLVQAIGQSALVLSGNQHFKSFAQIREEFRSLVQNAPPSLDFIFQDVADRVDHQKKLFEHSIQFSRLATVRASGLHGGYGLLHEATIVQANLVADFLECLAVSSRIRPYLEQVPRCLLYDKDRLVFIEDLVHRLRSAPSQNRAEMLASVYLVLPEVPSEQPEWLAAFERVSIAPRERDIQYLMNILPEAIPASLRKTTSLGGGIPVRVERDNPNALPIAPQFLRSEFKDIRDQWYADVGNANGRLKEQPAKLDLPPSGFIREVFAQGIENCDLLDNGRFTAHGAWPAIVSSLYGNGNANITPGPFWFIVRKTDDLGQLLAILKQVKSVAPRALMSRLQQAMEGIEAIRGSQAIARKDVVIAELLNSIDEAEQRKQSLKRNYQTAQGNHRQLPEEFSERIRLIAEENHQIGDVLTDILESDVAIEAKRYWGSILANAALDIDDAPALVKLLQNFDLSQTHTAAKKAIRRIDFRLYGPSVESLTK